MELKGNILIQILYLIMALELTTSLKILIIPIDYGFNSRVINMGNMGKMLSKHHEVHMLVNEGILDQYTPPKEIHVIRDKKPENARYFTDQKVKEEIEELSRAYMPAFSFTKIWLSIFMPFCENLVSNSNRMQELKDLDVDLLLVDNICECCRVVVDYLDKPVITYSNFGYAAIPDLFYPNLPSFVCDPGLPPCNSDTMEFMTRLMNFVQRIFVSYYQRPVIMSQLDELRLKYNINTTLKSMDSFKNSLVFVQANHVLHYPRPTMPNVIHISGYVHKWAKPLSNELVEVIESSGYDCTVVVSFGTLVPQNDIKMVTIMADILGELDALIIWRYTGEKPKKLADNIHFVRWFPQSAVLQHPKTCLFLTHAGISSTYEAVHAGVPVVSLPYAADQPYNTEILVSRLKMGMRDSLLGYTKESLSKAVKTVYKNPEFKRNARFAKELMEHEMIEPEKKILYWIDHVAKFGTSHLISKPAFDLNVLQFYSVDVIVFLLSIVVLLIVVCVSSVFICMHLFKKTLFVRDNIQSKKNK